MVTQRRPRREAEIVSTKLQARLPRKNSNFNQRRKQLRPNRGLGSLKKPAVSFKSGNGFDKIAGSAPSTSQQSYSKAERKRFPQHRRLGSLERPAGSTRGAERTRVKFLPLFFLRRYFGHAALAKEGGRESFDKIVGSAPSGNQQFHLKAETVSTRLQARLPRRTSNFT